MTENPTIPTNSYVDSAIRDFRGTVERGLLDSRDAQAMHADAIANSIMKGDLLWARTHAITLALHRDNRLTLAELYASRDARAEHRA